jgi:hypothetical protein
MRQLILIAGGAGALCLASSASAAWPFHYVGNFQRDDGKEHLVTYVQIPDDWNADGDSDRLMHTPFMALRYFDTTDAVPDHPDLTFNFMNVAGEVDCSNLNLKVSTMVYSLRLQDDGKDRDEWVDQYGDRQPTAAAGEYSDDLQKAAQMVCGRIPAGEPVADDQIEDDAEMALMFGSTPK